MKHLKNPLEIGSWIYIIGMGHCPHNSLYFDKDGPTLLFCYLLNKITNEA